MIHHTIQGTAVPALGFGTWQLEGDECRRAVEDALALGYRHIDTAQAYDNEEQVGRALKNADVPREEIFLTTKIWRDNLRPDDVSTSFQQSLKRLKTDYVDLLLIHWPHDAVPLGETLAAMSGFKAAGMVRHIGVSNFTPTLVGEALKHTSIFCNQVEYHPFLSQDALLRLARKHGFLLTAYSPLAQGTVMDDETLQEIAEAHGKTPAQVALRWLIDQQHVAAIPKASSHDHRRANFDIFDFELTDGERQRLDALAQGRRLVDPDFAPAWKHAR